MKRTATLLMALALLSTSCGSEGNMSNTTGHKLMTEAELIANAKDIVDREKFGLSLLKSPDGQCWDLPVPNWDMTLLALHGDPSALFTSSGPFSTHLLLKPFSYSTSWAGLLDSATGTRVKHVLPVSNTSLTGSHS